MTENRSTPSRVLVTAKHVADLVGVSQSAVSRAFTPGASIAPRTRKRIMATAEEVGYQPNLIARSLTRGRSHIVGIGIRNLDNPYFAVALSEMSTQLAAAGFRVLLFTASAKDGTEPSVQEVLQYRLDALVLLATTLSSNMAAQCQAAQIPIVLYNRVPAQDQLASSVTGDNVRGAQTIASFLLAGGHKNIAFISGLSDSSTSRQREQAFVETLAELGAPAPLIDQGHFDHREATAATRRLLTRRDRPDAIFCANDQMALAALNVAQGEFGLEIGRELSIVGFDDVPMAAWPAFSLTTFSQPVEDMTRETVTIIQGIVEGDLTPMHRVIDGSLIVRGSARRPRPSPA